LIGAGADEVDGARSGTGPLGAAPADMYCRVTVGAVEFDRPVGELECGDDVRETGVALVRRGCRAGAIC
jgi:hypothetical protein